MRQQNLTKGYIKDFNQQIREEILKKVSESYQKNEETFYDTHRTTLIGNHYVQQGNVLQEHPLKP